MPTLRDYVTETEQWADTPREGDDFDIELAPDELAEGVVIESDGEYIVIEIAGSAVHALEQRGMLSERIGRYGAVGSSRGMGFTVAEGIKVVKSDYDLDQMVLTFDIEGSRKGYPLQFTYWDYDEDFANAERKDVFDQLQQQSWYAELDHPTKMEILDASYKAIRGEEPSEYKPTVDDEPLDIDEGYMSRMLELAGITKPMAETAPIQPNPNAARTDPLAAKAADLAPVGTEQDPTTATTVDEGVMSEIDLELQNIAASGDQEELIDAIGGLKGSNVALYLEDMMSEIADELAAKGMNSIINDEDRMLDIMMDRIQSQYADQDLDEAEYQGRKVELNKPKRGGSKKFYVYVKDPKSGNVRKISFGDPNMKIKKSNPARRKSFRARHRCATAKDKTSARYWACRAW